MGYSDTTKNKLHNPSVLHETNFLSLINPSLAHVYCSKHCVNSNRREGEAIRIGREESEFGKGSKAQGRARMNLDYLGRRFIQCSYPCLFLYATYKPNGDSRTHMTHRLTHDATLARRSAHSWTWAELGDPSFPGPSSCLRSLPDQRLLPVGAQAQR